LVLSLRYRGGRRDAGGDGAEPPEQGAMLQLYDATACEAPAKQRAPGRDRGVLLREAAKEGIVELLALEGVHRAQDTVDDEVDCDGEEEYKCEH